MNEEIGDSFCRIKAKFKEVKLMMTPHQTTRPRSRCAEVLDCRVATIAVRHLLVATIVCAVAFAILMLI